MATKIKENKVNTIQLNSLKDESKVCTFKYNEDVGFAEIFNAIDEIVEAITQDGGINYSYYEPALSYVTMKLFTDLEVEDAIDAIELNLEYDVIDILRNERQYISDCLLLIENNVWRKLDYIKTIHTNKKINELVDALYSLMMSALGNAFNEKTGVDLNELLEAFIAKEAEQFKLEMQEEEANVEYKDNKKEDTVTEQTE